MLLPHRKLFKKNKIRTIVSLSYFLRDFWRKIFLLLNFLFKLTKFHWLVAFTLWDVGQYVYCKCLLPKLWRHKVWNYPHLSNQAGFSTWPKSLNFLCLRKRHREKETQRESKFYIYPANNCFFKVVIETIKKVWDMLKVNNKDSRMTSLTSFWSLYYYYLWTYFKRFSSVSTVILEQVNVCCGRS